MKSSAKMGSLRKRPKAYDWKTDFRESERAVNQRARLARESVFRGAVAGDGFGAG